MCRLDCHHGFLMRFTSTILRTEINDVVDHLVCNPINEFIQVFILPRWMKNSLEEVVPVHDNHFCDGMVGMGVQFHRLHEMLKI